MGFGDDISQAVANQAARFMLIMILAGFGLGAGIVGLGVFLWYLFHA